MKGLRILRKGSVSALDMEKILSEITRLPGVPGYEAGVNGYISGLFREYADEVRTDALENVISRVGNEGPRVMISAHQDEIGLVVSDILDDGSIKFWRNGGVDPRILPAMEVEIITKTGPVYGIVGAKPPHLLTDGGKNVPAFDDLHIDVGMSKEDAEKLIRVGDMIVFRTFGKKLAGNKYASKTMDDRASVVAMLEAARVLKQLHTPAEVYCVASSQEEVGLKGAGVAATALQPDFAIAVDVCHAEGPGTGKWDACPIDKAAICFGPNIHPMLSKKAEEVADKYHIPFTREISAGVTGTDAGSIQVAGAGVPVLLISIPLKYMHTTVETLDLGVIEDVGRLMALLIDELARGWEEVKWY